MHDNYNFETEFEHYSNLCGPCVDSTDNQNMYVTQKELLLWYRNLRVIMYCIQKFMRKCVYDYPTSQNTVIPLIITLNFSSDNKCAVTVCESFLLAIANNISPEVEKVKPLT